MFMQVLMRILMRVLHFDFILLMYYHCNMKCLSLKYVIVKLIPEEGEVKVDSPSSVSEDERRRRCGGEPRERQRRASEQPPAASASPSSAPGNVIVERQSGKSRRHTLGFDLFGGAAVNAGRTEPTVGGPETRLLGLVLELRTGLNILMPYNHETLPYHSKHQRRRRRTFAMVTLRQYWRE